MSSNIRGVTTIKHVATGNWKAVGISLLIGAWRLLVAILMLIPAAPFGDARGRVGADETPVAKLSQWLSAIGWVSLIPAAWWGFATAANPRLLWLILPLVAAGSFFFARRFSAHQGQEFGIGDWARGLSDLIQDPDDGYSGDPVAPAARIPFNPWRATIGTGLVGMLASIALALSPVWATLLPRGAGLVEAVAPFYPAFAVFGFWVTLIPSAVVGWRHGSGRGLDSNAQLYWAAQIQPALGVTRSQWEETQTSIRFTTDRMVISPIPPSARLKLHDIESRVELLLPDWSVESSDQDSVTLVAAHVADPTVLASREQRMASGGQVIASRRMADAPAHRRGAHSWSLNPEQKVNAAALDVFAQSLQPPMRLIELDEYRHTAVVAPLSPETARLRDDLAARLRCAPHDLELIITLGQDGIAENISIVRYPATIDDEKRVGIYLASIRALIPISGAFWQVDDRPDIGAMSLVRRIDRLTGIKDYPWDAPVTYTAIPFGVDTAGDLICLGLLETNQLLGGLPGSGKSGGLTALLAGISRLENVALVGLDPKKVELSPWTARFTRVSKTDEYTTQVLEALVEEMDRRYDWLDDHGLKKVTPAELSPTLPLIVLLIDELADLVSVGVTREEKEADLQRSTAIRRLIAKGRAAGLIVITATQKPQSDVIPTALRDLIQQRVAYSTTTIDMTDTILGKGMGNGGGPAHEIEASAKGVCYIVNESSRVPVRARTFWVPDDQVAALAERTAHLRVELPWLPLAPVKARTPGATTEPEILHKGTFEGFTLDDLEAETLTPSPPPAFSFDD